MENEWKMNDYTNYKFTITRASLQEVIKADRDIIAQEYRG